MKRLFIILIISFSTFSISCSGQSKDRGTVYAGVKTSVGSGAINRKDVGIFLRSDLTFTDRLDAPDWKRQ